MKTDIVNIDGFICKPEFSKKSYISIYFVNNRFIKSAYLDHKSNWMEGLLQSGHNLLFSLLQIDYQKLM